MLVTAMAKTCVALFVTFVDFGDAFRTSQNDMDTLAQSNEVKEVRASEGRAGDHLKANTIGTDTFVGFPSLPGGWFPNLRLVHTGRNPSLPPIPPLRAYRQGSFEDRIQQSVEKDRLSLLRNWKDKGSNSFVLDKTNNTVVGDQKTQGEASPTEQPNEGEVWLREVVKLGLTEYYMQASDLYEIAGAYDKVMATLTEKRSGLQPLLEQLQEWEKNEMPSQTYEALKKNCVEVLGEMRQLLENQSLPEIAMDYDKVIETLNKEKFPDIQRVLEQLGKLENGLAAISAEKNDVAFKALIHAVETFEIVKQPLATEKQGVAVQVVDRASIALKGALVAYESSKRALKSALEALTVHPGIGAQIVDNAARALKKVAETYESLKSALKRTLNAWLAVMAQRKVTD